MRSTRINIIIIIIPAHDPSLPETTVNFDVLAQARHLLESEAAEQVAHELWQAARYYTHK